MQGSILFLISIATFIFEPTRAFTSLPIHRSRVGTQASSRHKPLNRPFIESSIVNKAASSRVDFDQTKGIFGGDNIFYIHSLGALSFGSFLLLFPDFLGFHNPVINFAYQQWSIFILAISLLTYRTPALNEDTKSTIASTLLLMCLGESALYAYDIYNIVSQPQYSAIFLVVDFSSFLIFSFLAVGYTFRLIQKSK